MRSFSKAVSDITQNLVKTFKKACDVATDPNHSQSDIDEVWRDFENACKDAGNTSTDAAHAEVKEHVTRQMQDGGMSKAEAEKWFEHKWKDVQDLGVKVRKSAPKVTAAGKLLWLKVLGAIAAGGMFLYYIRNEPPSASTIARLNNLQDEARLTEQMQSFKVREDQFKMMIGSLERSAPAPVPMPVAVAAAAAAPVEVEVTTPSGTQTFTSTVGRVYQHVREARDEIERTTAAPIDHGYDHPDPPPRVAAESPRQHRDQGFHKEFTVNSPIGSAHFKY